MGLKLGELTAVLKADKRDLDKGLAEAHKSTEKLGDSFDRMGREAKKDFATAGAAAKAAGNQVDDLTGDMRQLERQIDDTQHELARLNREFARTGDISLQKTIRSTDRDLAFLQKVRKSFADEGTESAKSFSASFRDGIGSLPSELKGALIVGAVGLAVLIGPAIGAAVGGAVLGGVGAGGIIGGVALAAQDPRVKAAGAALGDQLLGDLKQSAQPIIDPLLASMDELRSAGQTFSGSLASGFGKLAPYVERVAEGVEGFADAIGPGLSDAFDKAGPMIKLIADELPAIGESISYALSSIAEESDGATMGLASLLHLIEDGIETTGDFIATLSAIYEFLVRGADQSADWGQKWLGWIPGVGDGFDSLKEKTSTLIGDLDKSKEAAGGLAGGFYDLTRSAADAKKEIDALERSFSELFGIQMSVDEANIAYQESIDKTIEVLKEGKRTLDINTQAGRENKEALLNQVDAINDVRDANIANGMSLGDANKIYDQQLSQLRKTLLSLGYNKQQVDALITAYKNVPKNVSTEVAAPGLAVLLSRLREVDRLFRATSGYHEYRAGERDTSRRWGGITEHAATGLLRDAGIYSAVSSGARYAFAEPATGGEGFVPRKGNYGRSMSIIAQEAAWYGATVVPGGAAGSAGYAGPETIELTLDLGEGIREVVRINLRDYTRGVRRSVTAGAGVHP